MQSCFSAQKDMSTALIQFHPRPARPLQLAMLTENCKASQGVCDQSSNKDSMNQANLRQDLLSVRQLGFLAMQQRHASLASRT